MGGKMVSLEAQMKAARSGAVNTNPEPDGRPSLERATALVDDTTPAPLRKIPTPPPPTSGYIASTVASTDVYAIFVDDNGAILSNLTDEEVSPFLFDKDHLPAIADMFQRALEVLKGRQRCTE